MPRVRTLLSAASQLGLFILYTNMEVNSTIFSLLIPPHNGQAERELRLGTKYHFSLDRVGGRKGVVAIEGKWVGARIHLNSSNV